ncbi:MAG: DUF4282 domain-containing protein [Phenylobacterium sp.]|uniref:DUF4282 domain-containing protein n=1 Tax=Phenylobacterium sp. TaxID=1871053 RepID=UPI002733AB98|nr:DUF4282 domain-containing protein [Phenylobacterium sp.]MDP3749585.1 DUF4282 domain-containing protein [Phenylobacterium sp.]
MRPPAFKNRNGPGGTIFWDLLTFEKLMTNQVIHLIYWSGLGVIALVAFGMVGAAVGVALREESWIGVILAVPVLVAGLLVVAALVLLWRSFCELYVALFRLSDDLHAIRQATDAEQARTPRP